MWSVPPASASAEHALSSLRLTAAAPLTAAQPLRSSRWRFGRPQFSSLAGRRRSLTRSMLHGSNSRQKRTGVDHRISIRYATTAGGYVGAALAHSATKMPEVANRTITDGRDGEPHVRLAFHVSSCFLRSDNLLRPHSFMAATLRPHVDHCSPADAAAEASHAGSQPLPINARPAA